MFLIDDVRVLLHPDWESGRSNFQGGHQSQRGRHLNRVSFEARDGLYRSRSMPQPSHGKLKIRWGDRGARCRLAGDGVLTSSPTLAGSVCQADGDSFAIASGDGGRGDDFPGLEAAGAMGSVAERALRGDTAAAERDVFFAGQVVLVAEMVNQLEGAGNEEWAVFTSLDDNARHGIGCL